MLIIPACEYIRINPHLAAAGVAHQYQNNPQGPAPGGILGYKTADSRAKDLFAWQVSGIIGYSSGRRSHTGPSMGPKVNMLMALPRSS